MIKNYSDYDQVNPATMDRRLLKNVFEVDKPIYKQWVSFFTTANGVESRRWDYYKYF